MLNFLEGCERSITGVSAVLGFIFSVDGGRDLDGIQLFETMFQASALKLAMKHVLGTVDPRTKDGEKQAIPICYGAMGRSLSAKSELRPQVSE